MKISMGAFPLPPTEAYYCPHCGRPLQEPLEICPTCGAPITQPHRTPLWLRIVLSIVLALFIWPLFIAGAYAVAFSFDSVGPGSPSPSIVLVIIGVMFVGAALLCCLSIAKLMGVPDTPLWLRAVTGLLLALFMVPLLLGMLAFVIGMPTVDNLLKGQPGMSIISMGGFVVAVATMICGIESVRLLTGGGQTKNQEKPSTDAPQL